MNSESAASSDDSLLQNQYRLKTIIDNAPLLMCYVDSDLRFRFVNARYADYYRRTPQEILGMHVGDLIGEKAWSSSDPHLQVALSGKSVRYQGIVDRPTGTFFFLTEAVPDFDSEGNVVGLFVSILDTTDLKRGEQRFRRAVESTNDGFWEWDLQSGETFVSPRLYQLLELDPESTQLDIDSLIDRMHPDDADSARAAFQRSATAGAVCDMEVRMLVGQTEYRWFRVRGKLAVEADGNRYWSGSFRDITAVKQSEAFALDAVRRRDRFLAILSHELRNPLAAIQNATRASRVIDGSGLQQEAMTVVRRQAEQMRKLLDDLLETSRIMQEKITLRRSRVDLIALANEVLAAVDMQARDKSLTIASEFDNRPLWMDGDATRLQQIQANLFHNAIKFSDPGQTITYRVARENEHLVISVADQGIGFSAADGERIFEFFQQADLSGIDRGGMGIGLSLARHLTQLHGGTIAAHSDGPGTGAVFTITFPDTLAALEKQNAVEPTQTTATKPLTENHQRDLAAGRKQRSILIVDDAADARQMLALLLEANAFEVYQATDGREALDLIRDKVPDLSLIDLGLPKLDGIEVAKRVRADAATAGLRLVALSGFGSAADREKTRSAGFDDHLIKPLSDADYERIISGEFWTS